MYILKNAWISIARNKGRNILIAIIIIVIASACAITLSIMNSADNIIRSYEEKYQVKATIGMNRDYLMQQLRGQDKKPEDMINQFNEIEQVSVDQIDNYGDSEYVSNYYYTYSLGMNANGISEAADQLMKETTETRVDRKRSTTQNQGSSGSENSAGSGFPGGGPGGGQARENSGSAAGSSSTTTEETTTETTRTEKIENKKAQEGTFTLQGYSSYTAMSDFITGNYTISDGQVSSDFSANVCVISKELADLNSLVVGSTIQFVDPKDTSHTYSLEVTGIYTENSESSSDMSSMYSNSANTIITNTTVVQNVIAGNANLQATVTPTYILKNSDVVDSFKEEVAQKGLSSYYSVSDNLDEVESATKGITNVGTFALTFLIITLIIGGVVLLVINMINIRERKYEIGVLRTIGMSKLKVIWQFVLELLIIAIVALLIGAGIGSCCSVSLANKLLETEIQNSQSQMQNIDKNFGGPMGNNSPDGQQPDGNKSGGPGGMRQSNDKFNGVVSISQVDSIEAVVDFKVLAQLLGIGLLLTIISSLSACIAIARFSPLTILRERS